MIFKTSNILFLKAALLGAAFCLVACDEQTTAPLGELNKNFASRTIHKAHMVYKDSGAIKMELKSPLIEEYELIDSPYTLMKKGLKVKFWQDGKDKPNYLTANWAKLKDREKFYEGKGNVVLINYDNDTLRTNHIFWDNKNRRIFTQDTVTIKRADGTINISNGGLDATEDFKQYTFFDNRGVLMYNKKEQKQKQKKPKATNDKLQKSKGLNEKSKKIKNKPNQKKIRRSKVELPMSKKSN